LCWGVHRRKHLSIWNEQTDRVLYQLVEETEGMTWADRAVEVSAKLGIPVTEDSARKRYTRIMTQIEAEAAAPPQNVEPLEVPGAQVGEYVGFRLGFYDIETSGLGAWNSEMTLVSIADSFGNMVTKTRFEFPQSNVLDDRGLVVWLRDYLEENFDILTAWNGLLFDLPYHNARLAYHGERLMNQKMYVDLMYAARGGRYSLKVGSAKLKNVAKFFRTPNQKPDLEWNVFRLAAMGDEEAIELLIDRCEADVLVMRDLFLHLRPVVRTIHK
jgi:uncharacterized protein YprB with RNaseH-like and TPR domain